MRKVMFAVLILFIFLCSFCSFAGPEEENGRWYYRNENGDRVKNSFVTIEGNLYYFGADGILALEGPVEAGGAFYYCDAGGKCLKGQWKYVSEQGTGKTGWHYYMDNGKAFEDGWLQIGEDRYHFTGRLMDYGWFTEDSGSGEVHTYYLGTENEGKMTKGWLAWKGGNVPGAEEHPVGWYYFTETGRMTTNTEKEIGTQSYAFNENGTMAVGFVRITGISGGEKVRYFDRRTGQRAEGWQYLSEDNHTEGWYYFSLGETLTPENGTRKITENFGVSRIDGAWYGFDGTGCMITGLIEAWKGSYFCFDGNGQMMTGYVSVSGENATENEYMMFSSEGTAPPVLGCSVSGILNGILYDSGIRICAESDNYEQIVLESGEKRQSYVVSRNGTVIRSGTVTLKDGQKKKVIKQEEGWKLVSAQDLM